MLPRGRRRGRGLLAPPVELPAEYLKKYPHSNRGVLCSQGRKKGDYHQSMDGNVFTDCRKVVLLPALAELGGMAARGRATRGRALRADHGGRLEGCRARRAPRDHPRHRGSAAVGGERRRTMFSLRWRYALARAARAASAHRCRSALTVACVPAIAYNVACRSFTDTRVSPSCPALSRTSWHIRSYADFDHEEPSPPRAPFPREPQPRECVPTSRPPYALREIGNPKKSRERGKRHLAPPHQRRVGAPMRARALPPPAALLRCA